LKIGESAELDKSERRRSVLCVNFELSAKKAVDKMREEKFESIDKEKMEEDESMYIM
jgi:hypothetical protein